MYIVLRRRIKMCLNLIKKLMGTSGVILTLLLACCVMIFSGTSVYGANNPFDDGGSIANPAISAEKWKCQQDYNKEIDCINDKYGPLLADKKTEIQRYTTQIEKLESSKLAIHGKATQEALEKRTKAMNEFEQIKRKRIEEQNKAKTKLKECFDKIKKGK